MEQDTSPQPSIRRMLGSLFRDGTIRQVLLDWRWILGFTRQHALGVAGQTALGLMSSILNLFSAIIAKNLIAGIVTMDLSILLPMVALMILCAALGVLFQSFSTRFAARLSTTMHNEVQVHTFRRLIHSDWMSIRKFSTGDLLNRFSGDISTVAGCAMTFLPNLIVQLFTVLSSLALIFYYDPTLALICLISTPLLFLASRTLLRRQHAYTKKIREVSSGMSAFESETFRNIDTLKGFAMEDAVVQQLGQWQKRSQDTILEHNSFSIKTHALLTTLSTLVQYTAMGYCILRLWQGDIILDTLVFFLQQRATLQGSFSALVNLIPRALNGSVAAQRIRELTEMPQDPPHAEGPPTPWCSIRLEHVTVAYEDGFPILDDVSLTAGPGEVIALVGPSGEGKTTLLRLLLGLIRPVSGTMELEDAAGNILPLGAGTRRYFSYVPQGNTLLAGSIAENLRLAHPGASEEEIIAALEGACAWEFVSQMPGRIYAKLGEGGQGISEGQAQRIAIARALMRKAPAMLLDEITSALDMETERLVLSYLMNLGVTCIVSTHRPSVLTMCSRAYRVEDGRLRLLTPEEIQSLIDGM